MRLILIPAVVLLLSACGGQSGPAFPDPGNRKLVWSDEFDAPGLPDPAKWVYDVGGHGWGNNESQYYTEKRPENARVENGRLIIEARRENFSGSEYTSARLLSHRDWQYGMMEIRAKLPKGRGTWPAIWMLPATNTYGSWPKSGEIDIMEHVGFDAGRIHGTVHTEAYNHTIGTQKGGTMKVDNAQDTFHIYAIDWSADKIDFFIDNDLYFSFLNEDQDYRSWPFDQPFRLILNIAVGGSWGGQQGIDEQIWPQRLEIDYVRVYQE